MSLRLPIRVLCVDDHAFLVEGLRTRLSLSREMEFVGRLPTAEDLVSECKRLRPDVVLMDVEMPGPDPFEALDDLRRQCPSVKAIMRHRRTSRPACLSRAGIPASTRCTPPRWFSCCRR